MLVLAFFVTATTVCDAFSMQGGYSLIWFILIYLTGAIIKKYNLTQIFSKKVWFTVALFGFLMTWSAKLVFHFTKLPFFNTSSKALVAYVSPTVVLMAVGLLGWFSKIKCKPSFAPIISFFATSAFSVYLIHDNLYVRKHLMCKLGNYATNLNPITLTLFVIGCVLAIFLACILIDKIRLLIFKLAKLDKLSGNAENFVKKETNAAHRKIERFCDKKQQN